MSVCHKEYPDQPQPSNTEITETGLRRSGRLIALATAATGGALTHSEPKPGRSLSPEDQGSEVDEDMKEDVSTATVICTKLRFH